MSSYQNLSVPFNIPIPGGMSPGKTVVVQGNIPSMSQRFAVNLLTRSGDIALHVCPKFKENRVIRNNVLNMNWGPEESHGSLPVYPGQSFEITILCESYSFKVSFNGRHFCDFSHRLPHNTISNLAVDGEVVVHNVNFKDGYGSNNNNYTNSVPYGFGTDGSSKYNSGGLYPTIDSYPYPSVPSTGRSPSPAPQYPTAGGFTNPSAPHYPSPSGPGYPSPGGGSYPQNPSLYPTQPGYPSIPHQGPYPQVPSPTPGGGSSSNSHSKSGFLDQAGAALAGVLGPAIIAGGINRAMGHGKPNLMDEAGRALAGVIGGAGLSGDGKTSKGTQPRSPTHQSGFLDNAGPALLGILGSAALAAGAASAANKSHGGSTPSRPQGTILDQAGSALAGIIGGSGLTGATGRPLRGFTPPPSTRPTHQGNILDQAGSALAGILGGSGLTGATGRPLRGFTPPPSTRPTQHGSFLDQAGSALADILGGSSGLTGRSQRGLTTPAPARQSPPKRGTDETGLGSTGRRDVLSGIGSTSAGRSQRESPPLSLMRSRLQPHELDEGLELLGGGDGFSGNLNDHRRGALGTAVAGAALTGHLNPIKATKKQLKAHKKALKYGLPIAGAGLGAYALHKGLKKGFRRSSSSSSCSSSD